MAYGHFCLARAGTGFSFGKVAATPKATGFKFGNADAALPASGFKFGSASNSTTASGFKFGSGKSDAGVHRMFDLAQPPHTACNLYHISLYPTYSTCAVCVWLKALIFSERIEDKRPFITL